MRIFISYAAEDVDIAEAIYLALLADHHEVFFDRAAIRGGEGYQGNVLRDAVQEADCFLFLISPASIAKGTYALTELEYAKAAWSHPQGKVIPVMAKPTVLESIPSYLKAVSICQTHGNLAAEVAWAVKQLHRDPILFLNKIISNRAATITVVLCLASLWILWYVKDSVSISNVSSSQVEVNNRPEQQVNVDNIQDNSTIIVK